MTVRIEGYVIVSADGMLADANHLMPPTLKFEGDQKFFSAGLNHAALVVHGRHSFEDQPNSPLRKRIILTRSVTSLAPDPENGRAMLWNPAGASFQQARERADVHTGTIAIIGGPGVFAMFLGRYDTFWLSQAPGVSLPGGLPVFPGVPERSPEDILRASGLRPDGTQVLDEDQQVTVTAWRTATSFSDPDT